MAAKKTAKKPAKKTAKKTAKKPAKKTAKTTAKTPAKPRKRKAPVSPDTRDPRKLEAQTHKHPELRTLPEVRAYLAGLADGRRRGRR